MMGGKRINTMLDAIVEIRMGWESRLWQMAIEAGGLLGEVDPQCRRPLLSYMCKEIYIAQGRRCAICKDEKPMTEDDIHEDHIVPISYGGGNERGNLRLVHAACNLARGNELSGHVNLYVLIDYIEDRLRNLPGHERLALMK